MKNQNVNREHQIGAYFEGKKIQDQVIGSVVEVALEGEMAITSDPAKSAHIAGLGVLYRQTSGTDQILSQSRKFNCSMEALYDLSQSGFALALKNGVPEFNPNSPRDLLQAGYEFVPWHLAPEGLQSCFNRARSRITGDYQGRHAIMCMGGTHSDIHFAGIGIVQRPAEPTARLNIVAHSDADERLNNALNAITDALAATPSKSSLPKGLF